MFSTAADAIVQFRLISLNKGIVQYSKLNDLKNLFKKFFSQFPKEMGSRERENIKNIDVIYLS